MATLISAPLPDLDLDTQATITVDTQDPNAVIPQLVIHLSQDVPDVPEVEQTFTPLFVYGAAQ